jgi:DNA-binding CsgD family transcriptional regulator
MASLWFILSIIFASFDTKKQIALIIFIVALLFTIATGLLMIFKNPYLPIDYGFDNCQFACVTIRIINFLIIGFLIFKILKTFFQTINLYINELVDKNIVLEQLKVTEENEAEQKLNNQILKSEIEIKKRDLEYKHKELTNSFSKILQFNTLLENIKKDITNKNYHDALVNVTANQSKNYSFESFVVKFNKLYPHFTLKLKESYPQLSETDIHLCILISAGLKSIEIAELLNVKEPTVGTYRNRLRKKFGLENNADISDFLLEKIKNL